MLTARAGCKARAKTPCSETQDLVCSCIHVFSAARPTAALQDVGTCVCGVLQNLRRSEVVVLELLGCREREGGEGEKGVCSVGTEKKREGGRKRGREGDRREGEGKLGRKGKVGRNWGHREVKNCLMFNNSDLR